MNINYGKNHQQSNLPSIKTVRRMFYFTAAFLSAVSQTVKSIFGNVRFAQKLAVCAMCAGLLGVFANAASAKEINAYYEADDGGAYFVRQIGDKIYWFGEDPNGGYANVLLGTISGNKITARFWDVPKGKTKGAGEIVLEMSADGASITKISSTVPFGTKTFKKAVPHIEQVNGLPMPKGIPVEARSRPAGFSGGEQNLTGAWQGDDGATYYVREMPGGEIVWVAENNFWGGAGGYAQPSFVHVFVGKKINQLVVGDWADVAKGKTSGSGSLSLKLVSPQEMDVNGGKEGIYATKLWRSLPNRLRGFADLHTHPMVNLGFGGKLVHGGTDVGALLPADADCNHNVRAKNIGQALGKDNSTHGGTAWLGLENPCGDNLRQAIIDAFQEQNDAAVTPDNAVGFPTFKDYPRWNDITHQKMWVDWIRRSYDGGQRVMVALAVNNLTIASGVSGNGDGPTDDKASADLQIKEIKAFVGRHNDFMEIAYTPADLRRIVAVNKLAIVLGVEIDNIGNFQQTGAADLAANSDQIVNAEIQRLYTSGVRYIFPVHLINNRFGATAVYQDVFNLSNYHVTGKWWNLQCSTPDEKIAHQFKVQGFDAMLAGAKITKLQVDFARNPPDPPNCGNLGHKNADGLTELGKRAIKSMMRRGMLIDIDHMSALSVNDALGKAEEVPGGYPLFSGHNSLRSEGKNENSRTAEQFDRLAKLGGMFGLGSDGVKAADYLDQYIRASKRMGAGRVSFGTDLNGLVKGPQPSVMVNISKPIAPQIKGCPDIYNAAFVKSKTGDQTWDFCTSGVAHYGMLADFLRTVSQIPQGDYLNSHIMENAEMFAEAWEKAEKNGKSVK